MKRISIALLLGMVIASPAVAQAPRIASTAMDPATPIPHGQCVSRAQAAYKALGLSPSVVKEDVYSADGAYVLLVRCSHSYLGAVIFVAAGGSNPSNMATKLKAAF